ncbi:hypothetical protein SLS60_002848 [Paraconiothyrium brasiliense]|uniref:Uncharacterized protein n=1 Tax=Paraconiothyrium brasiliense TaxID=300254 RepID=A0ABR3RTZ2_9PLEO
MLSAIKRGFLPSRVMRLSASKAEKIAFMPEVQRVGSGRTKGVLRENWKVGYAPMEE